MRRILSARHLIWRNAAFEAPSSSLATLRIARCLVLLFLMLTSLAHEALAADSPVEATRLEPTGPILTRIAWTGVEAFDEDELEERIITSAQPRFEIRFWKPKRRLDSFALEGDVDRIVEAYREIGFFSASAEVRIETLENDRAAVEFIVEEHGRVRLEAWTLEIRARPDATSVPNNTERERLMRHVVVEPDQPFGSKLYRERRNALLDDCAELGFPSARISGGADVEPDHGRARVAWSLDLGPRTYVGTIRIEGLEGVEQKIVLRELSFEEGDRFAPSKIEQSERKLVATGLFRSVSIGRPQTSGGDSDTRADRIDLEIRVDEAPPRSFRASIGYGTEDGPRGEVSLGWRNFTGEGRRLQMRAFGSLLDAGFEATLDQPYVWGSSARADVAVSALRQDRPGYDAFVTGASGFLTFYPDRAGPWSITIGPGFEIAQILEFGIEVDEALRGPRQSVVVNWFTVTRYQEIDDVLNPRSGLSVELRNEIGGYPAGSDLDYHRWDLSARLYRPMGPLVWAFRAEASTLDPIGDGLTVVPLTRRLYSGGTNSIRGFGFQKLGPKDLGNDPIGGLSRMELGAELRIPIWGRFGVVGFVDAGDVNSNAWSWSLRDLRASAGPGLRVDTPVGPLRFDFAWLLNRPRDADPWRFHLSVGHAF